MKIGIFSGSFDPIHTGHAMVANYLSQFCGLDRVWLMPSPLNPLKQDRPPISDAHRLEMCRIVARRCSAVEATDFEFSMPLPSYTCRTLERLSEKYPEHEFILVIGSDNWLEFDRWRDWQKILARYPIIIYPRPGYPVAGELPSGVRLLCEAPQALISSTFIRSAIAEEKNVNYFLAPEVADYIKKHRLYE